MLLIAIVAGIIFTMPLAFAESEIDSPRKQVEHGILPQDVKCKSGLLLILKLKDHMPSCVRSSSVVRLVHRGWEVIQNKTMENSTQNQPVSNATKILSSSSPHLAFLLNTRSPYYNENLQLLTKNLHSGDYLFIIVNSKPSSANYLVQQAKSMCSSGVNVNAVLLYSKLQNIIEQSTTLPRGIDWIIYDYENGSDFSPEFTTNETVSLGYFDDAKGAVEKYNAETGSTARFMVTPPYGELEKGDWNWGTAAQHMDGIDVQTQRLAKETPALVYKIADQINAKSPETFFMIQFSLRPSVGTVQDALNGMDSVKDLKIDALLVFYDQYSKNSQLEQFFSLLHR